MKTNDQILEEIRDRAWRLEEEKREELYKWHTMPAYETENRIFEIIEYYKKRKFFSQPKIQVRVFIPDEFILNTYFWKCYLSVIIDKKIISEEYASAKYCEFIFRDKSWKEETYKNVSFFTKPLEYIHKEKKSKIL